MKKILTIGVIIGMLFFLQTANTANNNTSSTQPTPSPSILITINKPESPGLEILFPIAGIILTAFLALQNSAPAKK